MILIRPSDVLTRRVLDNRVLKIGPDTFRGLLQQRHVFVGRLAQLGLAAYCWFTRTGKTRQKSWKNCFLSTTGKLGSPSPGWSWSRRDDAGKLRWLRKPSRPSVTGSCTPFVRTTTANWPISSTSCGDCQALAGCDIKSGKRLRWPTMNGRARGAATSHGRDGPHF